VVQVTGAEAAILQRIDAGVLKKHRGEKTRSYIGASGIGDPCIAYQALSLRGFKSDVPTPRQYRIFADGHRIEQTVLDLLRDAGVVVLDKNKRTGEQFNFNSHGKHFQANLDAIIDAGDGDVVLEVKSMNGVLFRQFKKHGLLKSHPHYYDQLMTQMGLSGIHQGALFAYCKDNSELHMQEVAFDKERFEMLNQRALTAMFGEAKRIGKSVENWPCSQCFKRSACHLGEFAEKKCSHCVHSIPGFGGNKVWVCKLTGRETAEACPKWEQWRPT
jgi:hypothetical protein